MLSGGRAMLRRALRDLVIEPADEDHCPLPG
jgi:hypothetical protein